MERGLKKRNWANYYDTAPYTFPYNLTYPFVKSLHTHKLRNLDQIKGCSGEWGDDHVLDEVRSIVQQDPVVEREINVCREVKPENKLSLYLISFN